MPPVIYGPISLLSSSVGLSILYTIVLEFLCLQPRLTRRPERWATNTSVPAVAVEYSHVDTNTESTRISQSSHTTSMSALPYHDGVPHTDSPPAYSTDTYPPPVNGIRLADTPASTAFEDPGAYSEQEETVRWRRSVEGEVSDLHLASEAEKKRLWWRNAVINALFIAAWCVQSVQSWFGACTHALLRPPRHGLYQCLSSPMYLAVPNHDFTNCSR